MPKIKVRKSVVIAAPVEKVFATVRDFKQWQPWSPWLIAEPEAKVSFADDGRSYSWAGAVTGEGQMEVLDEKAPERIDDKLTFLKPWKSLADVRFDFAEKDGGTEVSWSMDSSLPFFMFFLKGMMEGFVGMDYQRGLGMLKDYVETGEVPSTLEFIGAQSFAGFGYVGVKRQCAIADMGDQMKADFEKLGGWLKESGAEPSGKPFSIYHKWKPAKAIAEYTLGFPFESMPAKVPSGLVTGQLGGGEVYSVQHTGPYRHLGNAWSSGIMRGRSKVFRQNKGIAPFEVYENDPAEVEENALVTVVHFPMK